VSVPANASGQVGFSNSGYWGIPVNAVTYTNGFYIRGDYNGQVTLRLAGASSGAVYASQTITVNSNSSAFSYFETKYAAKQAPDGNNIWTLTFDASKVAGKALNFDLIQLYPPTFRNRSEFVPCFYSEFRSC
jgi:alpha-N-arabinofuranosidase